MKFLLAALVLSLSSFAHARGGDFVGNGGGLAEKNFLIVVENVERYSKLCISAPSCRLDASERETLEKIVRAMPKELKVKNLVRFVSEKKDPGFFRIDGDIKVAKTGSEVGTPIYINLDMINAKNAFGQIQPISIPESFAVLLHELGHHVSKASHQALDLLAVKVSMFLQNRIQTTPVLPWSDQISATIVQSQELKSFPQILLSVGEEVWDFSPSFRETIYCPEISIPILLLPFPDIVVNSVRPDGAFFHNVHWEKSEPSGLGGDFIIKGNLTLICPTTATSDVASVNSFQYRFGFSTIEENGKLKMRMDSVRMEQTYEPWYKLLRFPN